MSQPKNRRRAARRRAQSTREPGAYYIHVSWSGEARNPLGMVSTLDRVICVGFGHAAVYRDGEMLVNGERPQRRSVVGRDGLVTLRKVEKWIKRARQGHRNWTLVMRAPLWNATWERQRAGKWVCVDTGEGFA